MTPGEGGKGDIASRHEHVDWPCGYGVAWGWPVGRDGRGRGGNGVTSRCDSQREAAVGSRTGEDTCGRQSKRNGLPLSMCSCCHSPSHAGSRASALHYHTHPQKPQTKPPHLPVLPNAAPRWTLLPLAAPHRLLPFTR